MNSIACALLYHLCRLTLGGTSERCFDVQVAVSEQWLTFGQERSVDVALRCMCLCEHGIDLAGVLTEVLSSSDPLGGS